MGTCRLLSHRYGREQPWLARCVVTESSGSQIDLQTWPLVIPCGDSMDLAKLTRKI